MAIASPPSADRIASNPRILLSNVPWSTYQSLVEDPDNRHVRMTYDRGSLELMSPTPEHEMYISLFRRMIEVLTMELAIPIKGRGSTTFKRDDVKQGLEPDACYYLANERRIRGKKRIDLTTDPPPDLVIEVDITHSSLDRQSIYDSLRVPEIWRFNGESLRVYQIQADGSYVQCESSPTFPFLRLADLVRFATNSESTDDSAWIRSFLDWVRAEISPRFIRPAEGAGPA